MAQIGTADKWKIYIVRKANDPPSSDASFTDYSDYIISFSAEGVINQLLYFEAELASIETSDEKADITKGNLVYIMSGTKLVGKFVLSKPVYRDDFTVKISGFQSSGTEMINRKLNNEMTSRFTFDNEITCNVLNSTGDPKGILIDDSDNSILNLSSTYCGSDAERSSVGFDYNNRIKAIDKLVHTTGQEWWIDHGINDTTPYSGGDTLNMSDRQGEALSVKTFYLTGDNQNAIISEGAEEIDSTVNHIVLQGQDQKNNQIETEIYDAEGDTTSTDPTYLTDGWLAEDIGDGSVGSSDPGKTYFLLAKNGMLGAAMESMSGSDYYIIKIDNELVKATSILGTTHPTYGEVVCVEGLTRGWAEWYGTENTPHKKGVDALYIGCVTGYPFATDPSLKVYVDDASAFTITSPVSWCNQVLVGTEPFCICAKNVVGNNYLCARRGEIMPGADDYSQVYAHGSNVLVRQYGTCLANDGMNHWTPQNPDNFLCYDSGGFIAGEKICGVVSGACAAVQETEPTSPNHWLKMCDICGCFQFGEHLCGLTWGDHAQLYKCYTTNEIQQNGLFSKTFATNISGNRNLLDLEAQHSLSAKKTPIQKITLNAAEPDDIWDTVNVGDTITIADGSKIGLEDNIEVRITGFEYSFNDGTERLKLECNNLNIRIYPVTDYSYVEESEEVDQSKRQNPLRGYTERADTKETDPGTGIWSSGLKKVKDVLTPAEDYDAANKKYVDTKVGGASDWCRINGALGHLKPCCSDDVIPYSIGAEHADGQCIGLCDCYWYKSYIAKMCGDCLCVDQKVISPVYMMYNSITGDSYYLPTIDGTPGQFMCTDGLGALGWGAAGGASVWSEDPTNIALQPKDKDLSVYPRNTDTCDIGSSAACEWRWGFFKYLCASTCLKGSTLCSTGSIYSGNDIWANNEIGAGSCIWTNECLSSPAINLNGVTRTTWPTSDLWLVTGDPYICPDNSCWVSAPVLCASGSVCGSVVCGGNCVKTPEVCSTAGITLGGVRCTSWPSGLWANTTDPYICPISSCSICLPCVTASVDINALGDIAAGGSVDAGDCVIASDHMGSSGYRVNCGSRYWSFCSDVSCNGWINRDDSGGNFEIYADKITSNALCTIPGGNNTQCLGASSCCWKEGYFCGLELGGVMQTSWPSGAGLWEDDSLGWIRPCNDCCIKGRDCTTDDAPKFYMCGGCSNICCGAGVEIVGGYSQSCNAGIVDICGGAVSNNIKDGARLRLYGGLHCGTGYGGSVCIKGGYSCGGGCRGAVVLNGRYLDIESCTNICMCGGGKLCLCSGGELALCGSSLTWNGGAKAATIEYEPDKIAVLKTEEAPDVWFNDKGTTEIKNGIAKVKIDPIFKKVTEENCPYHVQITPLGVGSNYWVEKKENYFIIHSENNKVKFDWQISAIRKGYKNMRWKTNKNPLYIDNVMNTFESYNACESRWNLGGD